MDIPNDLSEFILGAAEQFATGDLSTEEDS